MNEIKNQPEALRLAELFRLSGVLPGSVSYYAASELRRLHAENQDLRARVQELGEMARENRSKKVIELEGRIAELEAQLSAIGAGGVEPLRKRADAAPQAVQAAVPEAIEQMAADRYKVVPSHESMFHRWAVVAGNGAQQLYIGREVECQNIARKFMGAFLDGAFVAMQNAAPAHHAEGVPAHETCETCQGNGEIVNDWDRYEHPHAGEKGDEAVSPCQDCEGTGEITPAHPAEGVPAQTTRDAVIQHLTNAGVLEHDGCGIFIASGDASELIDACMALCAAAHTALATQSIRHGLEQFIEQVGDVHFQRFRFGSKEGAIRRDIEFGYYNAVRGKTLREAITKALAAQAKQGESQQ